MSWEPILAWEERGRLTQSGQNGSVDLVRLNRVIRLTMALRESHTWVSRRRCQTSARSCVWT